MIRRVLTLGIVLAGLSTLHLAFGQDSIKIDTSSIVDVRLPLNENIQNYANHPDFKYTSTPDYPNSLIDRILNYIFQFLFRHLGNPIGGFIFKAFFIMVVVSLVFVLINQLMGGELIYIFKKKIVNEGFREGIEQEELEKTDYERLFKQAIVQDNFHAATRFGYLIVLKLLNRNELISWELQKTNLDYIKELKDHRLKPDFESLTTFYEFVEYGDFEIDTYQFETFKSTFNRFKANFNE